MKEGLKVADLIIVVLLLAGFILLAIGTMTGCSTFKPTIVDGQPQECNDMYTLMDFTSDMQGLFSKDNPAATTAITLMTLSYGDCKAARLLLKKLQAEAREQKRFDDCVKIIYGGVLLPKRENYEKFNALTTCRTPDT